MSRPAIQTQFGHYWHGNWIVVPMDDIIVPRTGRVCMGQYWWLVTGNNEVLFQGSYASPYCNRSEHVMRHLLDKFNTMHATAAGNPVVKDCRYIEMAYAPHSCSDYV